MNDIFTVTFAGNSLNTIIGAQVYDHEFNNLPSRDLKINKLARRDLSIITSAEYSSKVVTVSLRVGGADRLSTEAIIVNLKSAVQAQNAPLVVNQGNLKVEYTATMNQFSITWVGTTAMVVIGFNASDPIGKSVDVKTLIIQNANTTGVVALPITVDGSAAAKPVITVAIRALTGGTNAPITIMNGNTTQGITVTRTWAANDILIIDSMQMQVSVNGTIIDFSGIFPTYPPGPQQIKYVDGLTTRTVDISATYKPRVV